MVSETYDDGVTGTILRAGATPAFDSFLDKRIGVGPIRPGEYILGSVAPITDASSGAVVFDGGEIWVWDGDPTQAAVFLSHGGHLWDTANPVGAIFGVASEDITILEAVTAVPEPEAYALMGFGLGLVGWMARRRRQAA